MTEYQVKCNKCEHKFIEDVPPPSNAKPRTRPEDLEPVGTCTTDTGKYSKCLVCKNIGAKPLGLD